MSAYSKTVSDVPSKVLDRATSYFGPGGLGLTSREADEDHAAFVGGGGHVAITVCANDGRTDVELETQEWDVQVRQFLGEL